MRRRTFLATGVAFAGSISAGVISGRSSEPTVLTAARESDGESATTSTEPLLEGTDHETTLYAVDAPREGPTAMVFGGVHGDERNGIEVARELVDWEPDAGTLLTIPETDRIAVENDEREGIDGDLNRHFPPDGALRSELAEGIWDAVERHDPDVVLDLHRSLGIYRFHPEYVGQALFHSADADADTIVDTLNDDAVPAYLPFHRYTAHETNRSGPLLFQHAARELDATSYLFETTEFLLDRETKVDLTRLATAHVLALHGLLEVEVKR